jgi:hypothetical protein
VPAKITTPDTVETRIGTLHFKDGTPDAATVQLAYDQLDFGRGIDAFLEGMSATSVHALCTGFEEAGITLNQGIGITEDLFDARSLFLTANTTTVYVVLCVDLKDGPMVVRVPPRVLGPVDDADFRWVTDVGLTGPDKGAGGDYLFVPPGYKGTLPAKGYYVARPRTNRLVSFYRAFVEKGDIAAAVAGVKAKAAIFPLSQAAKPPATSVVDISGVKFNTISANDFSFYEELNAVVQNEPAAADSAKSSRSATANCSTARQSRASTTSSDGVLRRAGPCSPSSRSSFRNETDRAEDRAATGVWR